MAVCSWHPIRERSLATFVCFMLEASERNLANGIHSPSDVIRSVEVSGADAHGSARLEGAEQTMRPGSTVEPAAHRDSSGRERVFNDLWRYSRNREGDDRGCFR